MPLNSFSTPAAPAAPAAHAAAHKVRVSGSVSGNVNISFGHPSAKSTYQSNGYTMNSNGYLANPTHAAQVAANNAGALTRAEASSMGLSLGGR